MPARSAKTQKVINTTAREVKAKSIDVVVGATAVVGARLVRKLVEMGHEVRAVVLEKPTDVRWKNLPAGIIPYTIDLRLSSAEERKMLAVACKDANTIYHIASSNVNNKFTIEDYISVNVVGTENLLHACIDANGTKQMRFIYLSTLGVYGVERAGEVLTEESETAPTKPYTETKLMAEQVIKAFADANPNIEYTILRTATLYGPGYDRSAFMLFKYIKEQKIKYVGTGMNHATLVHVDDVVDSMLLAAQKSTAINKTYNVTDGRNYTVKEIVEYVSSILHLPPPKRTVSRTLAHLNHRLMGLHPVESEFLRSDRIASIEKIKKELGYIPKRSIESEGQSSLSRFLKGEV
jgi:nucleoside-diphosphate-sugar epimerase